MQILTDTSLVYYIILHAFCIAVLVAVFIGYVNGNWHKKADPNGRIATLMLINIISFSLLITIAALRAESLSSKSLPGQLCSVLWILNSFNAIFFWCLFVEDTNDMMLGRKSRLKYLWIIPFIPIIILVSTSPFTGLVFSLVDGGGYKLGPLFPYAIILYNIYYILIAFRALYIAGKSIYADKRRMFLLLALISVTFIISGYFRQYEMSCILHSLSAVVLYIFLSRDTEMKHNEILGGLADDFTAVFQIDVDKDSIYSVALNEDNAFNLEGSYWKSRYCDTVEAIVKLYFPKEEQPVVISEFEANAVYDNLISNGAYSKSYAITNEDGNKTFYSVRFVRSNNEKHRRFLLGIKNIDSVTQSRIRKDEILKAIAEDYDVITYVDAITTKVEEQYVLNPKFEHFMPSWENEEEFKLRFNEFVASHVAAEDRERFRRENSDINIMESLRKKNAYTCNFKLVANGKIMYYQLKYIAKKQNDEIIGIVMGFKNVDEDKRRAMKVEVENGIRSDVLNVLAYEYSILFFGNINKNTCNVMYVSEGMPSAKKEGDEELKSMKEAYDKYIRDMIHPEDDAKAAFALTKEEISRQLSDKKRFSVVIRCASGADYKYYELALAKAEEINEPAVNIAMGFAEIDREYRVTLEQEEKLKNALIEADASNNAKSTFLFNMSHDIRTPLNAITGFTELAQKHLTDTEALTDYLSKIEMSGKHLVRLVNEVLDMSRIEAGKINAEIVPTTMADMVNGVVNICKESAKKNGVSLKLGSGNISNRTILADELHVNQILMNIIGNSIKYTPKGGSITIRAREIKASKPGFAKYRLVIEDTGRGMSSDYLNHIFEYFSQERDSARTGIEGTGLGMAIVKKLVDFMEGDINIESELGKGTTVTVVLQFPVQTIKSLNNEECEDVEISLADKRILVVEDNDLNREIAVEIMKANKLIPEEACNGKEALEKVTLHGTDYYDFILMDIQMPVMNGYEATSAIRELPGGDRIAIIALSANAFEEDKNKSRAVGMNDHVAKPINVKELLRTLRTYSR